MAEAKLKRYEENEQSWKRSRCCRNPLLRHDRQKGEISCTNCGEILAQRTFGQLGRKGADRLRPYASPVKIRSAIVHAYNYVQRVQHEKLREYSVELRNATSSDEIDKILLQVYRLFGYRTDLLKDTMAIGPKLKASLADKKGAYK